jgi:spore coat polysaccharide biosynthesis protein SpsF (cytidylyltransferase family)
MESTERDQGASPPRVLVVVPCRLKSTRLPRKALAPMHGVPSIERCLLQCLAIGGASHTVLATSTNPEDDELALHDLGGRVAVVRGSEQDVLERFLTAMDRFQPDLVLRITGDCPVASHEVAQRLIQVHLEGGADLTIPRAGQLPLGVASEVYSAEALRRLRRLLPVTGHSEYLVLYFRNNPGHFRVREVELPAAFQHPDWRLTLDEQADLDLFEALFGGLGVGAAAVDFASVAAFLQAHPEVAALNRGILVKYRDNPDFVRYLAEVTAIPPGAGGGA